MTNPGRRPLAFQLGVALTMLTAVLSLGPVAAREAHAQVSSLPLQFPDVVIFATNSARLGNNAQVIAGHVVVNNSSPGPTLSTGFELGIGNNAHTPAGYAIVGDSIQVSSNAVIGGNAFFNNLSNAGTIQGSRHTPLPPFPIFAPLPTFQPSTPGTLDVTVAANQTQTLAPGNYRDIHVSSNATLRLSPGVYNVRSILTDSNAKILFQNLASGKADIRVQNQLTTGNNGIVRSDDGDPLKAAKIIFYVGFASGAGLTPDAVTFGNNGTIHANVYAPNGTVSLSNNVNATGAFLARDVDLGNNVHVDLETFFSQQAPAITSANATTFTVGQAGTFTVTATGFPTPSITRGGAALPSGVTFVDNGNGTGTLSGTPAAGTGGTYAIAFTASNGVPPNAVQNFTLTVNQAPAITSANAVTFTAGTSGTFTVTTTGFPAPSITRGGSALPSGVTFTNNGDGTGTLSGSPAAGTGGTYAITFTATNTAGSSSAQTFTLTVRQTPAITSANTVTFTVGQAGSFPVMTSGFPAPSIARGGVALPSGVTFTDNGSGTGTLSGMPAAGTGGSYAITFTATNAAGSSPTQNFTLIVNQAPVITSANAVTFTVGQAGSFPVMTSGFPAPSIAQGGVALPAGVTFTNNGNGTGTLNGIPATGTGGIYAITFTATNAAGSSPVQNFTLTVNEAPTITSANTVTFIAGQAGTFTVTTIGFPTPSIARGGAALPATVTFTDNGNGTGTLSGTPAAGTGGVYALTFTATNGIPPNAVQNFTLNVAEAPNAVADGPYLTDANTTLARVAADPDDLLDNDARGFPLATLTSFGGGSLGGTVTSNAAGTTATFGTGSLVVQSTGAFTFTPATGFTGVFTFQYRLTNTGGTSDATVTINVRPKATADLFPETVVGNVIVNTGLGTPFSILGNDVFNGTATINASAFSTNGGLVIANSGTGTFTYDPPVGFQGTDTFTYTIIDASGLTSAPATVSLTVSGMIWFVNNNTGGCSSLCNGRLTHPFPALQAFTSVNDGVGTHPGNGQNIFAYESPTSYTFTSGTLLRTGQKLIGQDATAPLATIAGVTLPTGSSLPAMNTGGDATTIASTVTLAGSSRVRGLTIATGVATGLNDPAGAISGIDVREVRIATSTGTAVNLSDVSGTVSLISVNTSGPANGIVVTNHAGTFAVTGTGSANSGGTIQNSTGDAVLLSTAAGVSLTDMVLSNSGGSHINAAGVNGLSLTRTSTDLSTGHGISGSGITNLTITGGTFDRGGAGSVVCNVNGVNITNLLGTSSVTGATFRRSNTIQFRVNNNVATNFAGAPDALTLSGTTWDTHDGFCAGDHLSVNADTGGNLRLVVDSSIGINTVNEGGTPSTGGGTGVQATASGTNGKLGASITALKTTNNTSGVVLANVGSGSALSFNASGNKTANGTGFAGTGTVAMAVTQVSSGATTSGTIDDNSILHTAGPATNAVQVVLEGGGTVTTRVSNDAISGNFQRAIQSQALHGTGTLNLTLDNNTGNGIDTTGSALQVFNVETGASGTGHGNSICLNMLNNDATFGTGATYTAAYRLVNRGTTNCTLGPCHFELQDFVGNGASAADVRSWVTNPPKSNTTGGNVVAVTTTQAFEASVGACPVP